MKRGPITHELKTWPGPFWDIHCRNKMHEVRKADRDFRISDYLVLNRWNPATKHYDGAWIRTRILYITKPGTFGLPNDLCVMSVKIIEEHVGKIEFTI